MEPRRSRHVELDEITLARAKSGDTEACRMLVERYQKPVFALLHRMMGQGGNQCVDDLAQETFLAVFRSLPTFSTQGRARLSTWILTIASRRAIDALRRPHPTQALEEEHLSATGSRADEGARLSSLAEALARSVRSLEPDVRAVFLLREYHEFDYEAIAHALGVELGTVKSRLARARRRVREALSEVRNDR